MNPLTKGKDSASMSLGGEGSLPTSPEGQKFASLSSLNDYNKMGMAAVLDKGGRLSLASAATGSGTPLGGGSTADGIAAGGINPLLQAGRSALGQFNASVGGGAQGGAGLEGGNAPLIQKTSLGLRANPNPWYDARNRKDGAVDYLAAYNAQKIRTGQVNLEQNKKNPLANAIDFDDSGTIKKIKHREGAGAAEIGMLSTVAALASLPYSDGKGHTDARAVTATNSAVKDANKWDAPLGRRISWALSSGRVPKYVQNIENDRLEREKVKARIDGSMAYVKGESGNAYTNFLKWKLGGPMDDDTRSMLAYTSEHTDATLGGFNLNRDSGIQRLAKMGMDINPVTMGIASHEGITGMKVNEQAQAIPVGLQLVNSYLGEMGIRPDKDLNGETVWNKSGVHWAAADGVLKGLSPGHLRVASAIASIKGIAAVTPYTVNQVLQAHKAKGTGESTQAYEKSAINYFNPPQQDQTYQGRNSRF